MTFTFTIVAEREKEREREREKTWLHEPSIVREKEVKDTSINL